MARMASVAYRASVARSDPARPMFKLYTRRSLKAKLAFWSAAAMVAVVLAVTSFALWVLRSDMTRSAAGVQVALVDSIARELDARVIDRRTALSQSAAVLGPLPIDRYDVLREHFASRPVVQGLFDVLIVVDRQGRIVFDLPELAGRAGRSVADRDYFRAVMATGQPAVSQPLTGLATNEPNIVFAAPLRSADGQVVGALSGIVYLTRQNFLTAFADVKIGKSGYAAVIAKGDPATILVHAHRDRILTTVPGRDHSPLMHRALDGEQGTFEGINSAGLEALFSFRALENVPWIVATAFPLAEAHAELRSSERRVVALGVALMLLAGTGIWLLVDHLLAPLDHLRDVMVASRDRPEPVVVDARDQTHELSEVAEAFNTLMAHKEEARTAQLQAQARLRTITDNLPVLIAYIDAEERFQFANATYRTWAGVDPQAAIGRKVADLVPHHLYEQRQGWLRRALAGERVEFEIESDSMGVHRHLRTVYVPDLREGGRVAGLYALSSDVTALKLVEARLSEQAREDPLTGLANRRAFDERLRESVARHRRLRLHMAVLFIDVDHFKVINDTHGHGCGDAVLREFAARLLACVRETDTVARPAGDEFVLILEALGSLDEAAQIAAKIVQRMRDPFVVDGCSLAVSASIGVAYVDDPELPVDEIVVKADRALYRAKHAGRDTFDVTTL